MLHNLVRIRVICLLVYCFELVHVRYVDTTMSKNGSHIYGKVVPLNCVWRKLICICLRFLRTSFINLAYYTKSCSMPINAQFWWTNSVPFNSFLKVTKSIHVSSFNTVNENNRQIIATLNPKWVALFLQCW